MAAFKEVRYLRWLKDLQSSKLFDPNQLDEKGVSCLHHVAFCGYLSCLKWLVKKGGKLTTRSAEESVVAHYAAAGGHLDCLKWIHKQSAKYLKIKDKNGASPLYFAAQEGHLDCVMWLAKHSGAVHSDVSIDGMTAVHAAAQEGFVDCLGFLVGSIGCSGLARDRSGNTPMHFAAAAGHRSCVQWLLGHGWGLGQERNKAGSSPLHIAAEHGHTEVVKLLIKSGVSLDILDRAGRSAAEVASDHGNEACAEILQQARRCQMGLQKADTAQRTYKKVRFERKAIEKDDSLYSLNSATDVPSQRTNERVKSRGGIRRPKSPTPQSWQQKGRRSRKSRFEDQPVELTEVVLQEANRFPFGSYKTLEHSQHMRTRDNTLPTSPTSLRSATSENGGHKNSHYDTNGNAFPEMSNSRIHSYDVSEAHPGYEDQDTEHRIQERNIGHPSAQNVFQKFYRFSRKKLARSSSFALQSDVYNTRRSSFYVSGSEAFILGSRYSQTLALDGGDPMAGTNNARFPGDLNGPKTLGTSFLDKRSTVSPTNLNQSTADKIRPDVAQDNALIW